MKWSSSCCENHSRNEHDFKVMKAPHRDRKNLSNDARTAESFPRKASSGLYPRRCWSKHGTSDLTQVPEYPITLGDDATKPRRKNSAHTHQTLDDPQHGHKHDLNVICTRVVLVLSCVEAAHSLQQCDFCEAHHERHRTASLRCFWADEANCSELKR